MVRLLNIIMLSVLLSGLIMGVTPAAAAYPERTIVLVVPYPAGGSNDVVARAFSVSFSKALGQTVVVKNVTGASGITGCAEVAQAKPDGYTLLFGPIAPMAMYPNLQKMPYSSDSLVGIFRVTRDYEVLFSLRSAPWKDFKSMVEVLKAAPGKYRYGSSNVNNPGHMANYLLFKKLGLQVGHLPCKGGPGAVQAMNAGNASLYTDIPSIGPTFDLLPIGVFGPKRLETYPGVPTFKELGVDIPDLYGWLGFFAPKGIAPEHIAALNKAAEKALQSEECKELFRKIHASIDYLPSKEFNEFYLSEIKRQRELYIEAGIIKP